MWTKRLTSHSPEFPTRADLIRHLLQQLVSEKLTETWIHVELVEEGGWLKNLLSGKAPFIEVALAEDGFELNVGFQKDQELAIPQFPKAWKEFKKGLRKVPATDVTTLSDWINSAFNETCSNSPGRKISGWIDGL